MIQFPKTRTVRQKAVWGPKRSFFPAFALFVIFVVVVFGLAPDVLAEGQHDGASAQEDGPNSLVESYKIDRELTDRAKFWNAAQTTRVIIELQPGADVPAEFKRFSRRAGKLGIINGQVVDLPNGLLKRLAAHPSVFRIHYDRPIETHNYRTALTTGSRAVQQTLGLTGAGVGVAIIDSGIASWHDDLTNQSSTIYPYGNQRVSAFVDFVNGQLSPYDDEGHGTHVAGIIAGNGFDSLGAKSGAAPGASLVALKVLGANGQGTISNIIKALDWVLANHAQYNIRVVNMSVGAAIHESYWTDPLTLAAKRVVDAGVVVVAAAGNFGKNAAGQEQYGGIAAPGNAPWVLTVGASSTNGTPRRADDTMASFSSRGPSYIDWAAKPDLVAPGTGTISLSDPGGTYYNTKPQFLMPGAIATAAAPYLVLSGTSMAAPVVTGTVALMLQANPALTPNAVKAILQYTAEAHPGYNALAQGAGFLNTVGAVRLARFFVSAQPGQTVPTQAVWSKTINWGNHSLRGGMLNPAANAFSVGTTWGAAKSSLGANIVWGTECPAGLCDNIVWGTTALDNVVWGTTVAGANIVWGTIAGNANIVWGTDCGGADCDNIVWGTRGLDNVVWGTATATDNIVWGTAGLNPDNIIWGTAADPANVMWSSAAGDDNVVWGTVSAADNIIWGTADEDNIVWGTAGDNVVWGTQEGANVVWGTAGTLAGVWQIAPDGSRTPISGSDVFDRLSDKKLLKLIESQPVAPVVAPVSADIIPSAATIPSVGIPPVGLPIDPGVVVPLSIDPLSMTVPTIPTPSSTAPPPTIPSPGVGTLPGGGL